MPAQDNAGLMISPGPKSFIALGIGHEHIRDIAVCCPILPKSGTTDTGFYQKSLLA